MKILIVGSGGREHALAWKISQSPRVKQVYIAPGNGGTCHSEKIKNISITDINDLADFAGEKNIYMTVVGPEVPLSNGIVDIFRSKNLKIFGPTKNAAKLESSKDFAKEFMVRNNIPTAKYSTFTDSSMAKLYVLKEQLPIVIKADGLAAGKGVVIAQTIEEAYNAIDDMIGDNKNLLKKVVIEEYLVGEEASFIVMSDGRNIFPLATSQDHKRLKDGDNGPNTGGMGAYSPASLVTPDLHRKIMKEVIIPTIEGMSKEGNIFTGFLYAGIMIGANGSDKWVKTLEFNCRMGDPETQPIMMRINSDFMDVLEHAINGTLDKAEIKWNEKVALGVVLAAYNYPEKPRIGDEITQLPTEKEDIMIFHAGTISSNETLKTNGGRVMCVTALGDSVKKAREKAYNTISKINFEGMQYRKDIGWRAIK
ncbi:phosphoribosylamine--glycine ligase [Candidatus Kinetoplastibacterium blastocrithidii TCC012E]|uniref:Phosphoribosylamine--glycine ligase n=1 Tax=Candidatus Kinetoplastidibacterium blastocrithidiae TCC012E TaxID=1208922 RepID=M1M394_9PROT|nr:phosphoribosylamine--glycine ligase [Candidatus Kinetoplastibacterium blastocrithidii]AFZ83520.1 phosphoribosylamine--glycine ligase [Candidatus Kinetoplastibacterium blastocrithidii (ex Strigomonas culicis)]AGF49639.1 phosphoribosylamine--glycine ligase [Candidatus Kinetoplastibacterium blastocrithidii TCC012E]